MRKVSYSILFVVLAVFVGATGGILAQGRAPNALGTPVCYEAVLVSNSPTTMRLARLESALPSGGAYVGLAAGSQVSSEAQQVGGHLVWEGPFDLAPEDDLILRYWLVPAVSETQLPTFEIVAFAAEGALVQAIAQPGCSTPAAVPVPEEAVYPEDVTVEKAVETPMLEPGDEPWVAYVVTFTNSIAPAAVLDWITDTLAPGFEFVGMAEGSDVADLPLDPQASTIVWEGPFVVPGEGTLRLRYWVKAVEVRGTYSNRVEATGGGQTIGPATATVTVLRPDLSVGKEASPLIVTTGERVTYDVTISNAGNYQGILEVISDTMPSGFTFVQMEPGSAVSDDPIGSTGTLIWTGPISVPPSSEIHVIYQVRTSGVGAKTNSVMVRDATGQPILPAESTVTTSPAIVFVPLLQRNYQVFVPAPVLSVEKVASLEVIHTGDPVTYDVTISNPEPYEGTVSVISDTLPVGFAFQQMDPNSDVVDDPLGSTGTIVWPGPFTVPPESELHLIYQVRTSGVGTWTNSVVVQDEAGNLYGPAESAVTTFFEETFNTGVPPEWTTFLNWPGLTEALWFWVGGIGWGRYDFDPYVVGSSYEGWGLSMYEGERAEEWSDYRIEATVRASKNARNPLAGIWFRGTHQQEYDKQGGDVTGYYLVLKHRDDWVFLGKIRADERKFNAVEWVQANVYPPGLEEQTWYDMVIEVEGARIRGWVEGELMIDWTDPDPWTEGTVGLAAFRGAGFDYIKVSQLAE